MAGSTNRWLFMATATLVTMIDMGAVFSFGAYFLVLMNTFQTDRSKTATVQSLMIGVTSCFGVISGILITKVGLPSVTLISSVLVTVGFCACFFATSIVFIYVSISIVAGIGISMAYISCVVVVSKTFKGQNKLICISVLSTSNAIASLIYPFLIDVLNDNYGVCGTFLIQGALIGNTCAITVLCWTNRSNLGKLAENKLDKNHSPQKWSSKVTKPVQDSAASSVVKKRIFENLRMLISCKFISLLLATGISVGALNGYFSVIMDITRWKGFDNTQSLMSIVIYQGFGVLGRLSPGIIRQKKGISLFLCPVASAASGCAGQVILYLASGYVLYAAGTSLCGIAIGGLLSSALVLVAELVQQEHTPVAFGLLYTVFGVMSPAFGYGFGTLRDTTGTYDSVMVIVGAILGITGITFSFHFVAECRQPSQANRYVVG